MDPNPLDSMELATRPGQKAPPPSAPNPLDSVELATRGQAVNIPDEQNPYKQPWSPKKFMVGMGKAFTEIPEGLLQLGADIFGHQAEESYTGDEAERAAQQGYTADPNNIGPMAQQLRGLSTQIGQKVASDAQAYKTSPYGVAQTKSGLGGEITGNVLPWLVMPTLSSAGKGASFLTRLGYGALNDLYQGSLMGATKPVEPGQSRTGNTAAYAAGSVALGGAARVLGEGARWAAASLPFVRKPTAAYQAGQFLSEQASPEQLQQGAQAASDIAEKVPGFKPTTAAAAQSPELGSVERYLSQHPEYAPVFNQTATDNKKALLQAIDKLSPGAMESSPTELSQAIGKNLNDIVASANAKEDAIWNDGDFLKLPTNVSRLKQGLTNWAQSLPVSDRNRLPSWPFQDVDQIIKESGPTAPISEIQALRSNILREARGLEATAPSQARLLNQMAAQLLKNLGTGTGFTAAEEQGGNALRAASAFTAQKHAAFEPLSKAIDAAQTEESRVGPWMTNLSNPVPERLDAYLSAGQKYLDNADRAPDDARAYFVNLLANSRAVNPANGPIRSANLATIISKNKPVIAKLFPSPAQQELIDNIQTAAKMGDYVQGQKPMDLGSDSANKFFGLDWLQKKLGSGLFGKVFGNVMTLPVGERVRVLSEALMDPQKAALLSQDATTGSLAQAAKVFNISGQMTTQAAKAYGAQKTQDILQKPGQQP